MNLLGWPFLVLWDFWTKPIRAESLAAFRILLGLTLLASLGTGILQTLTLTCGDDPLCPIECNDDYVTRQGRISLLRGPVNLPLLGKWLPDEWAEEKVLTPTGETEVRPTRLSFWLESWFPTEKAKIWAEWGAKPSSHYLLAVLFVLSVIGLVVGYRARLMALIACLLAATFHHRLPELMNGGDSLFRNGLYFLILSPCGAVWSVDRWLLARKLRAQNDPSANDPVFIAPWSVRLMQIQICTMYFFTGCVKLDTDYYNGEALYWVLNDLELTRWSYAQVPIPLFVCRLMTWGTLLFELGFTLFVCIRPLRSWVLLAGVGLHLGILLTMEIGWFSQVALCWYVLFVSGATVSDWVTGVVGWMRGKRSVVPEPASGAA